MNVNSFPLFTHRPHSKLPAKAPKTVIATAPSKTQQQTRLPAPGKSEALQTRIAYGNKTPK